MAATYLDSIAAFHRERAAQDTRDWRARLDSVCVQRASLSEALRRADGRLAIIAEVKRRSPSKGVLRDALDPGEFARAYLDGGASAISVLTDEPHFGGSRGDLEAVAASVDLPLLRKDFTISENDVLDTAEMGASGVLLIAALLDEAELRHLVALALEVGLSPLVEVHDAREADRAIESGSRLIGVNQRDLHTFEVNPSHAAAVISSLPSDVIRVAESGLRGPDDARRAANAGFDAVLVGETFVTSAIPRDAVASFAQVMRDA